MDSDAEVSEQEDTLTMSTGYSILLEKICTDDVKLVSWCPTMDLIAIALVDNSVHIHRLSWQRVTTIASDGDQVITALDWRPDGMCS